MDKSQEVLLSRVVGRFFFDFIGAVEEVRNWIPLIICAEFSMNAGSNFKHCFVPQI